MGTVQNIQSSFSEGRISPRLHGQIDIPSYKASVKELENFLVLPQGSATRRPGTYYVQNASTNTSYQSKLVPFYYGQGQSYILEFYAGNIKLFYNNGILGLQSDNATQFVIGSTGYTASEIADIKYIQSADVIFLAHPNHPPKKIERTVPTSTETGYGSRAEDGSYWTISNIDFIDGPYDVMNKEDPYLMEIKKPSSGGSTDLDLVEIGGVAVDTALDAFVNSSHGLQAGMKVYFHKDGLGTSGGAGNLVTDDDATAFSYHGTATDDATATSQGNSTTYFVVNPTATTFQISTTSGGTTVTFKLMVNSGGTLTPKTKWTGKLNVVKMILKKDRTNVILKASGTGNAPFTTGGSSPDIGVIYRVNVLAGTDRDKIKGIRWTSIKITGVTSTTEATGTLQEDCVLDESKTLEWQKGVFNSTNGYPRDVSLYQQRLAFAGSNKYPSTIWFSKTGDFFNFASSELLGSSTGNVDPTGAVILGEQILDDNALTFTIDSDTVDKIQWLSEGTKLALGTTGGVFTIYGSENDLTLTPYNFTVRKDSAYPAGEADAIQIGERMLYVQQNERKIREINLKGDQKEEYGAMDLTLRSEDITYTGVKELTYQEQPFSVVWGRLGNGKLIALTHEASLNMFAWTTHTIGGSFTSTFTTTHGSNLFNSTGHGLSDLDPITFTTTDTLPAGITSNETYYVRDATTDSFKISSTSGGSVLSITSNGQGTHTWIPDGSHARVESIITIPEDNRSQTWMIVKRTIGGSSIRHIEYMTRYHDAQEVNQEDANFVDSARKTYNSSKFTTASGYNHLEGETVSVLGDGALQPDRAVSSNQITLGSEVNTLVAGFPYTSELVTLPMTQGDGGGSFVIGNKRMIKINVKMLNSLGLKFAMEGQDFEEVVFRNPNADLYGQKVPLFSGNKEMAPIARSFESEGMAFQVVAPFPFTFLYIASQYEVNLG